MLYLCSSLNPAYKIKYTANQITEIWNIFSFEIYEFPMTLNCTDLKENYENETCHEKYLQFIIWLQIVNLSFGN